MTKPNPSLSEASELQRQSYYSQDNPITKVVFAKNKVAIAKNKVAIVDI